MRNTNKQRKYAPYLAMIMITGLGDALWIFSLAVNGGASIDLFIRAGLVMVIAVLLWILLNEKEKNLNKDVCKAEQTCALIYDAMDVLIGKYIDVLLAFSVLILIEKKERTQENERGIKTQHEKLNAAIISFLGGVQVVVLKVNRANTANDDGPKDSHMDTIISDARNRLADLRNNLSEIMGYSVNRK